jgi:hypothetical protein
MIAALDAHLTQPAQAVDVDYTPGEIDRTAPERIWLQLDTDGDNQQRDESWTGRDGVTWCDESIGGLEIQYVRADLATSALAGEKAEGHERSDVWGVQDETGQPVHCAAWPEACHEHINDAINEHGIEESKAWRVLHYTNGECQ